MKHADSMSGPEVGHALSGFGVNLLVRDTQKTAAYLEQILGFKRLRLDKDYGLFEHLDNVYQIHCDGTYLNHPLLGLMPENGLRGLGVELRLYDVPPDETEAKAVAAGYEVLQQSTDKPHGLRECYLLDPDGYCWVPSIKI